MRMKVVDNSPHYHHHLAMQVERDDTAEKRWGDGWEKSLMNEHPTRGAGVGRMDSFDRLAMEAHQQQRQQQHQQQQPQQPQNQYIDASQNYTRTAPARRDINATKSNRRLMRQVSGLGMEDPVFGTVETLLQHPSNIFDDMGLGDVPEDMRDLVSIASDPTAAANGANGARGQGLFDTEKFHASLGVDFYASISDFSLMELDLTPPTATTAATTTTTSASARDQQETKTVVTPDNHHGERNTMKGNVCMELEEEDEDFAAAVEEELKAPAVENLNMSTPSLSLSHIFSSPDTRKVAAAAAAAATTPCAPRGGKQQRATGKTKAKTRQNSKTNSPGAAAPPRKTKTRRPLPQSFPPEIAVSTSEQQQQQQQHHDTHMMEASNMDGHDSSNGQLTKEVFNMSSGTNTRKQRESQKSQRQHSTSTKPISNSKNDRGVRAGPRNSSSCGDGVRKRKSSCKATTTATTTAALSKSLNELSVIEAVSMTTTTHAITATTAAEAQPTSTTNRRVCKSAHGTRRASGAGTDHAICMGGKSHNINHLQQQHQQQIGGIGGAVPYQLEKPPSLISAKQRTMPQLSSLFPTRVATAAAAAPSSPVRPSARDRISAIRLGDNHKYFYSSPVNNNNNVMRKPSVTSALFTSSYTCPPVGTTSVNHLLQSPR